MSFEEIASDLTPYSFLQIFPQDEHERLLIARLEKLGIAVERQTALLGYRDLAHIIRTRLVPSVLPILAKFEAWREFMFRTVSQVTINYRNSELSKGKAGDVHGGDRLPWVVAGGSDNYASLAVIAWQVHVYGAAGLQLMTWCKEHDLPLHVFPWRPEYEAAGFARNALYLLRPDTYIALADASGASDALARYFEERGIRIGPPDRNLPPFVPPSSK